MFRVLCLVECCLVSFVVSLNNFFEGYLKSSSLLFFLVYQLSFMLVSSRYLLPQYLAASGFTGKFTSNLVIFST
uniref:Candidate secreted effector n=1 Tax=Meloidogyne incognita TaxID=6306 RepID=A0A914L9K4_MELIC